MLAIDDWQNVYGTHFARLLEAYCACLHAHHPATFVFADDLAAKKADLKAFRAVLVVGQTVEIEPALADALAVARRAGVKVFHDDTCRMTLMKEFTPLKIAFDQFEKDRHPASDDAAYSRFPLYCLKHVAPLRKALDPATPRVAVLDNPEVFVSERRSGKGRFVFVINNTTPNLDPGQMWRVSLLCASRVPALVDIDLDAGNVYDVFAGKKVLPIKGFVRADCRDLHGRLFAVLPEPIADVLLIAPKTVSAGGAFRVRCGVLDTEGRHIAASLPIRVRLLARGALLEEQTSASQEGGEKVVTLRAPLMTKPGELRVEVVESITGRSASATVAVMAADEATTFGRVPEVEIEAAPAKGIPSGRAKGYRPPDQAFGPHLRDVAVSADGGRAYLNAFNWDHNLYALDLGTGETAWRRKVGHYFAFAPRATRGGVAVQGFDFATAQGYHLYDVRADGKAVRRFALYGLPGRLPHRFVPSILGDRINNFAAAPSGAWFAGAGNLGVAVWSRDGTSLWKRDWWLASRQTPFLAALGGDALLLVEGLTATAVSAKDGKQLWEATLGASGGVRQVRVSGDGKTVALRCDGDGGEIVVLREGKVRHRIAALGDDMALSHYGEALAVVRGTQLAWFESGSLRWVLPGDDKLQHPRVSADGRRVACCGETGTVYVVDRAGESISERDFGQLAVPAWLPKGDLLLAGWMGKVERLAPDGKLRWSVVLRSDAEDVRGKLLAPDSTPTARVDFKGNAEAKAWDVKDNLIGPKTCRIDFVSSQTNVQLARPSESLVDGKSSPHAEPWLAWADVGGFAEGVVSNALQIDTFNRQLRVEAITLVEDPRHPESWLRDVRLEYWEPTAQAWRSAGTLVSDAATHTHRLATPRESARWRLVPSDLSGNLRLAQVALHGKDLGPSHPDVMAKRPVAVLFDESDELKHAGLVGLPGITFAFGDAHSGGRFLHVAPGAKAYPPWRPPFGHVLPGWDFPIAEKPGPGEYRYLRFAYKALSPKTTGLTLRLDGESYGRAVSVSAGAMPKEDDAIAKKVADEPALAWTVVEVDLWEVLKKPTRIRGLRLESRGGAAGFDRVLLGRTLEDLKPGAKR
jgi:outer membrane protein assembly factor BamB